MGCAAWITVCFGEKGGGFARRTETRDGFREKFEIISKLGEGAFGQVFSCRNKLERRQYAVKVLKREGDSANNRIATNYSDTARHEALIWSKISGHTNIVSLHDTYYQDEYVYFVMECCKRSLYDELLSDSMLPEVDIRCAFRDMLSGIAHVHAHNIAHCDIKPDNFLINENEAVALCDFGLASFDKPRSLLGKRGTTPFMSPEMLHEIPYNRSTDIWSFGVTAYLILFGCFPYLPPCKKVSTESMQRAISLNMPPPSYLPVEGLRTPTTPMALFVTELLERDMRKRKSANDLLSTNILNPEALRRTKVFSSLSQPVRATSEQIHGQALALGSTVGTQSRELQAMVKMWPRERRNPLLQPFSDPHPSAYIAKSHCLRSSFASSGVHEDSISFDVRCSSDQASTTASSIITDERDKRVPMAVSPSLIKVPHERRVPHAGPPKILPATSQKGTSSNRTWSVASSQRLSFASSGGSETSISFNVPRSNCMILPLISNISSGSSTCSCGTITGDGSVDENPDGSRNSLVQSLSDPHQSAYMGESLCLRSSFASSGLHEDSINFDVRCSSDQASTTASSIITDERDKRVPMAVSPSLSTVPHERRVPHTGLPMILPPTSHKGTSSNRTWSVDSSQRLSSVSSGANETSISFNVPRTNCMTLPLISNISSGSSTCSCGTISGDGNDSKT